MTEDQKAQFKTIMESRRNAFAGNREEMRTLMTAKRDGTITPEQQQKLEAFKAEMKENGKKTHEQVLAILTPEQRAQLDARKEEMKRKREERRQLREQIKTTTPEPKKDND
ncbi:MAG: Spy/CpxP family protein refolding chaperone [Acidobacteria bacterium]|nr:Spy/CpxP family protein refolding chaperone [Acidobacteriota bacterium]